MEATNSLDVSHNNNIIILDTDFEDNCYSNVISLYLYMCKMRTRVSRLDINKDGYISCERF